MRVTHIPRWPKRRRKQRVMFVLNRLPEFRNNDTDVRRIIDAITRQSGSNTDVWLLERRHIVDAIKSQSSEPPQQYRRLPSWAKTYRWRHQPKTYRCYWNVDGDRELLDTWTGFTRFTMFEEKPPDAYTWSRRRLTRKQTTSRPDRLWPEMWKHMSDASKRKEKQKWAVERHTMPGDYVVFQWFWRWGIQAYNGKYLWKWSIWASQHHSLTMCIWVALKDNVR